MQETPYPKIRTAHDRFRKGLRFLKTFVARNGHALVPQSYVWQRFRTGAWVAAQRAAYRAGVLSADRIRMLEAVPGWQWAVLNTRFNTGMQSLSAFAAREGHAVVPNQHLEGTFKLGQWVRRQRDQYSRGKLIIGHRIALESIPGWAWDVRGIAFEDGLRHLAAFAARNGHAKVPAFHIDADGYRLANWVNYQRSWYKCGKLPPERIRRIEAIGGWSWDLHCTKFESGLQVLTTFIEREGHANVSRYHMEDGFHLGSWVTNRNRAHQNGTMPDYQADALESLPGWTWKSKRPKNTCPTHGATRQMATISSTNAAA